MMDPRVKPAGDAGGLEASARACCSHRLPGPLVPAKAGTQVVSRRLDSRLRGNERRIIWTEEGPANVEIVDYH
jgi:hypothetical protein